MRRELDVSHVGIVTEPGVDAILARGDGNAVQALLDKVCVSRLADGAVALVLAGHHDCAANHGDSASHAADLTRATTFLRQALPELPARAVYVDSTWSVRPHASSAAAG